MENNYKKENLIRIERIFDAGVALLWRTWTEPELVMQWFGSDPYGTVKNVVLDLTIGGAYEITFADSDGSVHTCRGTYIDIVEQERLLCSWEWESEPGFVSELEVLFFSQGGKSKIIIEHRNLNPGSQHAYEAGWSGAFDKIENILSTVKTKQ